MMKTLAVLGAGLLTSAAGLLPAQATSDEAITLGAVGSSAYTVSATSDPLIAPLGTDNPTLALQIGKRYKVTNGAQFAHPFSVIARGASFFDDTTLMAQGSQTGTVEGNAGVGWLDSGADMYFTLTPQLVDLMTAEGKTGGNGSGG